MTANYMHKVGTVSQFTTFTTSVLLRWRGGLFQAIYPHILYYILAYIFLATIYTCILQQNESLTWYRCLYEQFVLAVEEQANDLSGMIRLMIGFFVSQVCRRWWWQFQGIANADYIALMLLGFVNHKEDPVGKREEGRLYRRAIVRYINLAIIETLRNVSLRTAKRFPTYDDLVACQMVTEEERS